MTSAYGFTLPNNRVSQPELRHLMGLHPKKRIKEATREMLGHDAHEEVHVRQVGTVPVNGSDLPLTYIVAVHNSLLSLPFYRDDGHGTRVLPVLGGNRPFAYAELGDPATTVGLESLVGGVTAIRDAKELSRGMTYKWGALNLLMIRRALDGEIVTDAELLATRMGGGKSVDYIEGLHNLVREDRELMRRLCPIGARTPHDLTAFEQAMHGANAQVVCELGGRYIFAPDMNTDTAVMEFVRLQLQMRGSPILPVACLSEGVGGSGDPSLVTAEGVYFGTLAGAEHVWGREMLTGKTIGVQGAGKVGYRQIERILEEGHQCKMIHIADTKDSRLEKVQELMERHRKVEGKDYVLHHVTDTASVESFYDLPMDVFCPNAVGQVLTTDHTARLIKGGCRVIAGGANNQRHPGESEDVDHQLVAGDVAYAPDYVINLGGILNVIYERDDVKAALRGSYNKKRPIKVVRTVNSLLRDIFRTSKETEKPTQGIADAMVETHIARYAMLFHYRPTDLTKHRYLRMAA